MCPSPQKREPRTLSAADGARALRLAPTLLHICEQPHAAAFILALPPDILRADPRSPLCAPWPMSCVLPCAQLAAMNPNDVPVFHPTDMMEVDVEDSLALDHDAPTEKTDADFFNDFPDDFDDEDLS